MLISSLCKNHSFFIVAWIIGYELIYLLRNLNHCKISMQGKLSNFGMITPLDVQNLHKIGNAQNPYKFHVIEF
jgi:hypothetical protein